MTRSFGPTYPSNAFAENGTRSTIPDTPPVDNSVNKSTGYPAPYSYPVGQSGRLLVERTFINENFYELWINSMAMRSFGTPEFILAAQNGGVSFSYDKGARVRFLADGTSKNYLSMVDANTATPGTNNEFWMEEKPSYVGYSGIVGFVMDGENSSSTVTTISSGIARSVGDTTDLTGTASIAKKFAAPWAAGSGVGVNGLATGATTAVNTTVHFFVFIDSNRGALQAGWDSDVNGTNLQANAASVTSLTYNSTDIRRIHSTRIASAGALRQLMQVGDWFYYETLQEFSTIGTSVWVTYSLVGPPKDIGDLSIAAMISTNLGQEISHHQTAKVRLDSGPFPNGKFLYSTEEAIFSDITQVEQVLSLMDTFGNFEFITAGSVVIPDLFQLWTQGFEDTRMYY